MSELFNKFSGPIARLSHRADDSSPAHNFRLWKNDQKHLECFYAPFERVNTSAKIVLIGITPGRTQMNRALNAAAKSVKVGVNIDEAVSEVKRIGSFSGSMRPNIVNTLNKLGYQKRLGIHDSSELWSTENNLVNFCSLLKYPVFIRGKDYNGNPNPFKVSELERLLIDGFAKDLQSIPPTAELVPLGDFVASVISELDRRNLVPQKITRFEGEIVAPPHPSGANAESISLLLSNTYPEKSQYLESKYREYLSKRSWEKRANGKPQPEEKYKAARASRWESMLFVRKAYGINT
ncbi:hypothetical protein ACMXYR_05535 [Neptuniibacter sp. QD29_5]|uniref:hypothetical protein n=1 Tax=Neptuniibacter sp. QD29_5 TaxID=3398207 RepID=UPI0039F5FFE4